MKPLPKKITKSKLVELYANQMSTKKVLDEIRSFQQQLGLSIKTRLLNDKVKQLFFKDWGLPTGYEMTDETKLEL